MSDTQKLGITSERFSLADEQSSQSESFKEAGDCFWSDGYLPLVCRLCVSGRSYRYWCSVNPNGPKLWNVIVYSLSSIKLLIMSHWKHSLKVLQSVWHLFVIWWYLRNVYIVRKPASPIYTAGISFISLFSVTIDFSHFSKADIWLWLKLNIICYIFIPICSNSKAIAPQISRSIQNDVTFVVALATKVIIITGHYIARSVVLIRFFFFNIFF